MTDGMTSSRNVQTMCAAYAKEMQLQETSQPKWAPVRVLETLRETGLTAVLTLAFSSPTAQQSPFSGHLGDVIRERNPKRRPGVTTRKEEKAMLINSSGEKRLLLFLMYGTGLRL